MVATAPKIIHDISLTYSMICKLLLWCYRTFNMKLQYKIKFDAKKPKMCHNCVHPVRQYIAHYTLVL